MAEAAAAATHGITSKWKTVSSASVNALLPPPCRVRYASYSFSSGKRATARPGEPGESRLSLSSWDPVHSLLGETIGIVF